MQYEFTRDVNLFQAPASYPEAPKDMWYEVPPKPREEPKPKHVFPWEGKAPRATRVFPVSREPTPPPEPAPEPVSEPEPELEPTPSTATSDTLEPEPTETPTMASPDPWAGFQSRSNAWDDVPEIERYMQALQGPRKAKIQVLHNTAVPQPRQQQQQPPPADPEGRRHSVKLTDFPTELERPSLPVTPAPIRRPSFWGEERDERGNLPAAEGVPKQEEWVRRFSSYPVPEFPALPPLLRNESGVLVMRCQFCGKQNPIAKLEELQRKQSEVLAEPSQLQTAPPVPTRQMPGSQSKEAAVKAAEQAAQPAPKAPKPLKPILKQPSFEVPPPKKDTEPEDVLSPTAVTAEAAATAPAQAKDTPITEHVESTTTTTEKSGGPTPSSEATVTV